MQTGQETISSEPGPWQHLSLGSRAGAWAGMAIGLAMLALLWIRAPFYFTTGYRTFVISPYLLAYAMVLFALAGGAFAVLVWLLGRFCSPLRRLDPHRLYRALAVACVPAWLSSQYVSWVLFRGRAGPALAVSNAALAAGMVFTAVIVYRQWRKPILKPASKRLAGAAWCGAALIACLSIGTVWTRPPRSDTPPGQKGHQAPAPSAGRVLSRSFQAGDTDAATPPQPAPRIVLITLDTLRRDRLGCYGYNLPTSPNLDAFADKSMRFENAYALASGTVPSFCSMFSGTDPVYTGGLNQSSRFSQDIETFVEKLHDAGYWTDATVCQGFLIPQRGFAQGFDSYTNIPVRSKDPDAVTDAAIQRLATAAHHKKAFFWFHYFNTHTPYDPPPKLVEMFKRPGQTNLRLVPTYAYSTLYGIKSDTIKPRHHAFQPNGRVSVNDVDAIYDAGVRHLDDSLGRLLDHLRHMDGWDRTAVIITADHGEALGEHGVYCRHCVALYDAYVRIPLIVKWPKPTITNHLIRPTALTSDIAPTICALAGLEPGPQMTGRSLMPFATTPSTPWPQRSIVLQTAFCEGVYFILNSNRYAYPDWAIFDDGYKFVLHANSVFDEIRTPLNYLNAWRELVCGHVRPDELYHLSQDRNESNNLIHQQPDLADKMRQRLLSSPQLQFFRSNARVQPSDVNREELERLRSLGYL